MKFGEAGNGISTPEVEVLNVSPHGFWLLIIEGEYFLGFENFPWFRGASIGQLINVQFSHGRHLYWPALDVDLDLDRIEHPEKYPLVARSQG